MKVIIAGGRDFKDYGLLKNECNLILQDCADTEIVSGKQVTIDKVTGEKYGADYLGEKYARENSHPVKPFPADWKKFGKAAGVYRNQEMAVYADMLIAFWDGKSTGTKNMINNARRSKLKIHIVHY